MLLLRTFRVTGRSLPLPQPKVSGIAEPGRVLPTVSTMTDSSPHSSAAACFLGDILTDKVDTDYRVFQAL